MNVEIKFDREELITIKKGLEMTLLYNRLGFTAEEQVNLENLLEDINGVL